MIRINKYIVTIVGYNYLIGASNKASAKHMAMLAFAPNPPPSLHKKATVKRLKKGA